MNYLTAGFMVGLMLFGCTFQKQSDDVALPYYNTADLTPEWIDTDSELKEVHTVADFSLLNQDGELISNKQLDGKVYVANFFFTICPGVCPKMNGNLKLVQEEFEGDDRLMIISHSVMPWVDSVVQLKSYAERNTIDTRQWQPLTGDKTDIYRLARESYFADEGFGKELTSEEDFLHTEKVILVDTKRRIRGVYNGTLPLDIKRMMDDIQWLLAQE